MGLSPSSLTLSIARTPNNRKRKGRNNKKNDNDDKARICPVYYQDTIFLMPEVERTL